LVTGKASFPPRDNTVISQVHLRKMDLATSSTVLS
jgi:hypothetical protein